MIYTSPHPNNTSGGHTEIKRRWGGTGPVAFENNNPLGKGKGVFNLIFKRNGIRYSRR